MPPTTTSHAADRLRTWLERTARRRHGMPEPQVLVRAPGFGFDFGDLSTPFHAASVGKLMTAALIARLTEEGRFDFTTPLGALLPPGDLTDLPAAPGADVAADVTVEHLLTHTSGIPDYFEPPGRVRTAASSSAVAADRDRRWRPADLLDQVRGLPAAGFPGERFHYADTGYVLLGRIAEEAAGGRFSDLLRERVLDPVGMAGASTPYDPDDAPEDLAELDVAPFWLDGHELSRAHSVSIDWACGGVVGTAEDFLRFQRALHGGRLVSPESLEHLLRPRRRFRRGIRYGAGAMTLRFGEFLPPLMRGLPEPVGHNGVWATHLYHYPEQDAHVVLNFHSTRQVNPSFMAHARIARLLTGLAH
ncbi:serine hydrolase domain-containing protein [Nocardiopsis terrae]